MPFYEYQCSNCGHELEELQRMSDAPLTKCPSCGKDTLKKLIGSGGGIIFKGSGFYHTDYKNKTSKDKHGSISSKDSDSNKETIPSDKKATSEVTSKGETSKTETSKTDTSKTDNVKTETVKKETSKSGNSKKDKK